MAEWESREDMTVALLNQKMVYVGSAEPGTIYEGQLWVDVTTDPPLVKIYDLTNTAWMEYRPIYYETQTGAWANPAQTPVINGTIVVVYNSTQTATRLYMYSNSAWVNIATAIQRVVPTLDDSDESTTVAGSTSQAIGALGFNIATATETTVETMNLTVSEDDTLVCAAYGISLLIWSSEGEASASATVKLYIDAVEVDSQGPTLITKSGGVTFSLLGTRQQDTATVTVHATIQHNNANTISFVHAGSFLFGFAVKT